MRLSIFFSGPTRIDDYKAFRSSMVEPDFQAFANDDGDLRLGLHSASSLFHLHDWVWDAHEAHIRANFQWHELGVGPRPITRKSHFADALADLHPDFELVRAIANAGKHLTLFAVPANRAMPAHRPSDVANTYVQVHYNFGLWKRERVVIQGNDKPLLDVLTSTREFWDNLITTHGW